jgi:hypothetical protein
MLFLLLCMHWYKMKIIHYIYIYILYTYYTYATKAIVYVDKFIIQMSRKAIIRQLHVLKCNSGYQDKEILEQWMEKFA